jgi:hypothetical protein
MTQGGTVVIFKGMMRGVVIWSEHKSSMYLMPARLLALELSANHPWREGYVLLGRRGVS